MSQSSKETVRKESCSLKSERNSIFAEATCEESICSPLRSLISKSLIISLLNSPISIFDIETLVPSFSLKASVMVRVIHCSVGLKLTTPNNKMYAPIMVHTIARNMLRNLLDFTWILCFVLK